MTAVTESPEDDTKLKLTFKEKMSTSFVDPTPRSSTFTRVVGIVAAILAFIAAIIAFVFSLVSASHVPLYRTPINYCVIVFLIVASALMLVLEIFPGSRASKSVIEDAKFLGDFFGRGWFYLSLGLFYLCSGHVVCIIAGIYLLVVGVIFVTLGAIEHEQARQAEKGAVYEKSATVIDV